MFAANIRRPISKRDAALWISWLIVVSSGVLGLAHEPRLIAALGPWWVDTQALFGVLLVGLVFGRCYARAGHQPAFTCVAEIRQFSRQSSRMVYLSLYLVIGTRQLSGIVEYVGRHGTPDLGLLRGDARGAAESALLLPTRDFQFILAYGLIALMVIRLLAVWLSLNLTDGAALREAADRRLTNRGVAGD